MINKLCEKMCRTTRETSYDIFMVLFLEREALERLRYKKHCMHERYRKNTSYYRPVSLRVVVCKYS